MRSRKILILGTGALATLFAAKLAAAGTDISMLGTWPEALEALNMHGAQVDGEAALRVRAMTEPADCYPAHLALVLVKSWQTERAARQLVECLVPGGLTISLQNGLGNDIILKRYLSAGRVIENDQNKTAERGRVVIGTTTLGAMLLAPGLVRMAGDGSLWVESHPCIGPLVESLRAAGIHVILEDDIRPRVWGKLVINAAINPLSAILRMNNGELLTDPKARQVLGLLAVEAANVAHAQGILLPFTSPESAVEDVAEQSAENLSSMLRDVLRGAPTEVDAINGEVVRWGEKYELPVPVNRLVLKLVQGQKRLSSAELSDMVRLD